MVIKMKNKKTQLRWFSIVDYEKEEEYLREQHKKGWKFTGVHFPGFYHFVECTPEDVVYQLDYNQEGIGHKAEYVQMFHDCGWEYLFDFFGYSYFRKPSALMDGPEEIFCDDDSRLDMMKRVFKGRVIPLIVIFCGIIIPQMLQSFLNNFLIPISITFVILFVIYLVLFAKFALQYLGFKRKVGK